MGSSAEMEGEPFELARADREYEVATFLWNPRGDHL